MVLAQMQSEKVQRFHAEVWAGEKPHPVTEADAVGRRFSGLEDVLADPSLDGFRPNVILEIGSEFGGSTRYLLKRYPNSLMISVDPWIENYPLRPAFRHLTEFTRHDGFSLFGLFKSYCWEFRDRLLPVRAFSDAGLTRVFRLGLRPDLIYIDGDHRYHGVFSDLSVCRALFPKAIVCGDDWRFNPGTPKYLGIALPVRRGVEDFARHYGLGIKSFDNSWLLVGEKRGTEQLSGASSIGNLVRSES